jgi:hypothetical protein
MRHILSHQPPEPPTHRHTQATLPYPAHTAAPGTRRRTHVLAGDHYPFFGPRLITVALPGELLYRFSRTI